MLVRKCDCCDKEIKDNFINFHIVYQNTDKSGETLEDRDSTLNLEYCQNCFDKVLENLGLERRNENEI